MHKHSLAIVPTPQAPSTIPTLNYPFQCQWPKPFPLCAQRSLTYRSRPAHLAPEWQPQAKRPRKTTRYSGKYSGKYAVRIPGGYPGKKCIKSVMIKSQSDEEKSTSGLMAQTPTILYLSEHYVFHKRLMRFFQTLKPIDQHIR